MIKSTLEQGLRIPHLPKLRQHASGGMFLLLVVVLVGSLLHSTLSWMWDDERLPLSKIVLQGDLQYVSAQDVQNAFARLDYIGTFMSQDVNALQERVEEIPWVSNASIRKQWPDTVKVYLTEFKAEAIWNGISLLNETGVIFDGDVGQLREERIKLYGPEGSNTEVLSVWRDIAPRFEDLGLSINTLLLNERRAWQIILDNGMRLELGKESLHQRIERFISLYKNLGTDVDRVSYIDLRYDTGAAVGWFPEQELGQENTDDEDR